MSSNDFTCLDAQSSVDCFAVMTSEEHQEYQSYLDAQEFMLGNRDHDDAACGVD